MNLVISERHGAVTVLTLNDPVRYNALDDAMLAALREALDTATGQDREQRVFLRADKGVPYGAVMAVLNLLRRAGYLKIALVGLDASQTGP